MSHQPGTYPKVTPQDLEDNIESVEIVKHVTNSGKILRWAVLNTKSGFSVTGRPSASVSVENDREATGVDVAIKNAKDELWGYMGYALAVKLHQEKQESTTNRQLPRPEGRGLQSTATQCQRD